VTPWRAESDDPTNERQGFNNRITRVKCVNLRVDLGLGEILSDPPSP